MMSFGMMVLVAVLSMSSTSHCLLKDINSISLFDLDDISPGNVNDDIDFLLPHLNAVLPSSVKVDDLHSQYAYNCYLTGLNSGIRRDGDARLDITDNKAVFSFGLSTNRINLQCSWNRKVWFKTFRGTVKAYTNKISVDAKFSLTLAPGGHPLLDEFRVTHVDKIKTDVSGGGFLLNWIAEYILNRKANAAKDRLIKELEQGVAKKLQSILDDYKLPTK